MNSFTKLLLQKFLDWQKQEDERRTVAQFAGYIGLGHKTISHAMNGNRPPSLKTVEHLAKFFNDPQFYDAAEMDRPDPLTKFIMRTFPKAPEEIQRRIAEELSPYTTDPIPNGEVNKSD